MPRLQVSHEVIFHVKPLFVGGHDLLKSILIAWGYSASNIVEQKNRKKSFLSLYCSNVRQVLAVKYRIKKLNLKHISVVTKVLKAKDWQDVWKKGFKPFTISPSIDIVPAWRKGKYKSKKGRLQIFIDTSVAFGTGMHPTTQCMVGFIERLKGRYNSVLDFGTGTGILAIAAEKMGARDIKAVDISMDAVKIAKENLKRNHCRFIRVSGGDVKDFSLKQKFDLVLSNLVTDDLICLKRKIFSFVKKGGYWAVSGVSQPNYRLFRRAYKDLNLKCVKSESVKGWTAVLFKRV